MRKLTLVSIVVYGKTYSTFVDCEYVDGRAIVPSGVFRKLQAAANLRSGQTYSIG